MHTRRMAARAALVATFACTAMQAMPACAADQAVWPPAAAEPASRDGCSTRVTGSGHTIDVGPGHALTELTDVPWLSLRAGDVVNIHHRSEPYRTKFALRAQGSMAAPVVINGVTDLDCRRPVIGAENAVTARDAAQSRFMSKQYSEFLGAIFLHRAPSDPYGHRPKHIRIQNLKITGAHRNHGYVAQDGSIGRYAAGAAGIYAVVVEDLTVENCEITGNGNGIFVNSRSNEEASRHIVIRSNRIHGNGNVGSHLEHNLYVQTARALYEGNYIGQLVPGARGSSLKDRSSGTVIRYNHIVAAARALDLVEIEDGVRPVLDDPTYPDAWVYGNLIVNDWRNPGLSSVKTIHWGGDNSPQFFRCGTLHFYNNTVVVHADRRAHFWYVSLFDMPTREQKVEARANLIYNAGDSELRLAVEHGFIDFKDTNWISAGWQAAAPQASATIAHGGFLMQGKTPELDAHFVPSPSSPAVDQGALTLLPGPAVHLEHLRITHQFVAPRGLVARRPQGKAMDLGAFERP
jgi:hypothetical protein